MLNNELDLELDDVHITESKRPPKISRFDKLRPVLKTFMPISRRPSQIESIIALNKRNMAVPELDGLVDLHALGERLITQFIGSYVEEENMWLFDEYKRNPIRPNTEAIEDWLSTQDPAVRKMLNPPDEDITHWRWDKYKFMIKPTVKPTLDTTAPYTNNALQTIACQEKYHNAIFCPIFKEMDKRLECLYKERFRVFTRTTNEDFAKRMNEIIPPRVFKDLITSGAKMLEIDISKYDKSQGLAALFFDCMLMDKVGVDKFYVDLWYNAHAHTTLVDSENGVKYRVDYQRKSGDASTFCQNTRFLMAVVAIMFDMNQVYFGMFAGDDSWLLTKNEFRDMNAWCATLLNLESKFFKYSKSIYFCSKYFIHDGLNWYVVPDTVKLLVKLGRSDLANFEHVEEYRTSLIDLTTVYDSVNIIRMLTIAIAERYNVSFNVDVLMGTLRQTILSKESFHSLYYSLVDDVLCADPTTSKL